jgi:high-affinity Fe2+/Pb2+ permease
MTRRPGSRSLLAVALVAGIVLALFLGVTVSRLLLDALGIESGILRIALMVLMVVLALPAGFYLVEKAFLARSEEPGDKPGKK